MSQDIEERLERIPIVQLVVRFLKKIRLPGFEGLTLYDFVEMYVIGVVEGAVSTRASAIAFSFFIALFPFLVFLLSLFPYIRPYITVPDFDLEFLAFLETLIPKGTEEYFTNMYEVIKGQKRGGILSTSFLITIFLIANGVNSIFTCFENSYHVELTRNFFRQYLYALGVGLLLSLFFMIATLGFIYFEVYTLEIFYGANGPVDPAHVEGTGFVWVKMLRSLFFAVISYFITAILYYFGTREGKHARFFSIGALTTTLLYMLTSYLFGIYVENFARYNEFYGSLGALLVFMLYIWLNANILILGFELNATLNGLRRKNQQITTP